MIKKLFSPSKERYLLKKYRLTKKRTKTSLNLSLFYDLKLNKNY